MNKLENLKNLIDRYSQFMILVQNLFRTELSSETPLMDWRRKKISKEGTIGEYQYSFHGMGVRIEKGDFGADIEFGNGGAFGFFDAWRLSGFAENFPEFSTDFGDESEVKKLFESLFESGFLKLEEESLKENFYRVAE